MRHFISTVYRILKLECRLDEIVLNDRVVDVDTFPMGINYDKYYQAISDSYIQKKAEELKESFGKNKIILSVDRLDYSKGISLRLKSFDEFLDTYPEYKGKNSLVMIVSPSRDQVDTYAELKNEIDQMVGAINGKHAMADWTPVYYFYRSFEFEELAALYNIAEIALVTPLRDGMNLVAKEYLAAKRDNCGVLILSEMAGAAVELTDAIIINPNNTKEIVEAIREVIEMPEDIQKEKLLSMQRIISEQTVEQWAKDFVYELRNVETNNKNHNKKIVGGDNLYTIKTAYKESTKRLFLLDYDGTLVAFNKDASKALPTSQLLDILSSLAENKKNHVVITSGRNYDFLDKYLGHLPIDMAAEHGASYKEDGVWHKKLEKIQWDNEIIHIFSHTIRKTPGSRMEIKDTALVWHYREVDSWLADLRVNQLIEALITPVGRNNLQIMKGNKIIEVKSNLVSKGTEAQRLIEKNDYDFILSVGDDTTDEEMFAALPEHAISIKVGKHTQSAKYTIPFQKQVLSVLAELQE